MVGDRRTRGGARAGRRPRHQQGERVLAQVDGAVSGKISIVGVWTGAEQKAFEAVLNGFTTRTRASRSRTSRPATTRRRCSRPRSPAATRPTSRRCRSRASSRTSRRRGRSRTSTSRRAHLAANYPASIVNIGKINGHVYGAPDQGRQQVDGLVQRRVLQGRRRQAAEDVGRLREGDHTPEGVGPGAAARSAAQTVGRSPTCSRTSTSARRASRSTTRCPRTRSSGPTRRS